MLPTREKTRTLRHCWWEHSTVQSLWKTDWKLHITLNIHLLHDPAILLLGIHPRELITRLHKDLYMDFPGGAVVENPPANAGDTGSSPGPGRSHMPRSNEALAPQLRSPCSRACEPQLLSPRATTTETRTPRARAPHQEKPPQWEARALQWRVAPARRN